MFGASFPRGSSRRLIAAFELLLLLPTATVIAISGSSSTMRIFAIWQRVRAVLFFARDGFRVWNCTDTTAASLDPFAVKVRNIDTGTETGTLPPQASHTGLRSVEDLT